MKAPDPVHDTLRLKPRSTDESPLEIILVGEAGEDRLYLGAWDAKHGAFCGHVDESEALLRWFEEGARRVRKSLRRREQERAKKRKRK